MKPIIYFTRLTLFSLIISFPFSVFSQVTELSNTPFFSTDYLGWDASTGLEIPLDVKHMNTNNPQPIRFYTNATERMRILSGGNVGIGSSSPAYKLDVTGDINISSNQVYRINGNYVLGDRSIGGTPRNIFVGLSAGLGIQVSGNTGYGNSCFGAGAGYSLGTGGATSALYNILLGTESGFSITEGDYNTIAGNAAGMNLTVGTNNLFAGSSAGRDLTTSDANNFNVILGANAGYTFASPVMTTGTSLTLVGFNTEASNSLTNASAIGANASVTASNSLILGSINGSNGASANTNVGIGTTSATSRLHVLNNGASIAGYFDCTNTGMTDIIKAVYNQTSTGSIDGIEVSLTSSASSGTYTNAGVRSAVTCDSDNHTNIGVYGYGAGNGNAKNYGGYFWGYSAAVGADENFGVYAKAESGANNYGIYASYSGTQTSTDCAAYLNGDGYSTSGIFTTSDISLKQNIQPFIDGLSIISQLNPKSFEFRTTEYPQINFSEGINYGLIAQELEPVIPSVVEDFLHPATYDSIGNLITPAIQIKAVNYAGIVPFLIAAIKEQQQQIDELNSRVNDCCGPGIQEFQVPAGNTFNQTSTISNQQLNSFAKDLPVLSQNQPNPFNEKTSLRFYLPKGTKEASLKVYDNTGSVYRLFALTGEGPGTIEIEGNTLAAGNYYYSLLIGGNVIDTKTMVITK